MLAALASDFARVRGAEVVTVSNDSLDAFTKAAASSDLSLVIAPEFDGLLERYSEAVIGVGGRLLGSTPPAIRMTADKLALAQHWTHRGIRTPPTDVFDPRETPNLPGPWVVKPRRGAGSQATFLMCSSDEREAIGHAARREWPRGDLLIQPCIAGQPASVALLIGPAQTIALAPARQHLSGDGRFRYQGGSLPVPAPLAERATRLALQAVAGIVGLRGYVGVDLILGDDGVDHAIEINPRLTTSYLGLRRLCTGNLAKSMLQLVIGEEIEPPQWRCEDVGFAIDSIAGIS
jgi:predicted ATP-grasp superfamily ATP-dependent carboligase